jgi:hypothetical protein
MARGKGGIITKGERGVPVAQRFNSAEEIAGRTETTKQSAPTSFSQIGPEDSGKSHYSDSKSAELITSSGNKFSDFTP